MLSKRYGGVRQDADTDEINLAYPLEDGMKIYIPTKQEIEEQKKNKINEDAFLQSDLTENYITSSSGVKTEKQNESNKQESKVNINTATQTQLETLPGIGPSTAAKIIDYRKEKGKFTQIEDIKEVSGIGESKFEKIKEYITVK